MWIDLAAATIFILSVVALVVLVVRKFPTLATVDPAASAGEVARRKHSLIEERLRRKVTSAVSKVSAASGPVATKLGSWWQTAHKKLVDLEHEYKVRSLPVFLSRRQRQKIDHEIATILAQAQEFLEDKEFAAAEEKAMQAVRLEPRSVPAFDFLGQLYLTTKEYGHAKEVYQYLLKLTGESDAIYEHLSQADHAAGNLTAARDEAQRAIELNRTVAQYHFELAGIYHELQAGEQAFTSIQEAVRLEPNNPKILDQYVEICISEGKKQFAEDAVARITESNPDNGKLTEWRERIAAIAEHPLTKHQETSTTL